MVAQRTEREFEAIAGFILPTMRISEAEWWGLEDLCGDLDLSHEPKFSCNQDHEVWPADLRGYHYPQDRREIQGKDVLLDRIVHEIVKLTSKGKRFKIQWDGVYLADGGEKVLAFELYDWEDAECGCSGASLVPRSYGCR